MFEDKIISRCGSRHTKLKRPALIAAEHPETQVKIYNKSAYYVINDCADITLKYLPLFAYSRLSSASLKGAFTEQDIIDFVGRAAKDIHTRQLLQLILDDITTSATQATPVVNQEVTDFTIDGNVDDVYGDYDYTAEDTADEDVSIVTVDINNGTEVINKLKEYFLS